MTSATPFESSRLRVVVLLLAAWLAFFSLLELLAVALSPGPNRHWALGPSEFSSTIVWTALSIAIVAYHKRIRGAIPRLLPLIAAHLPLFVVASLADALATSWV